MPLREPLDALRQRALADPAVLRALAEAADEAALPGIAASALPDAGRAAWAAALAAERQRSVQPPQWVLDEPPPAPWLPVQVFGLGDEVWVEWLHFGTAPLSEPFFEQSVERARALPAAHALRCRSWLETLAVLADGPQPDGLVFHMSRCGSTLVAQMLGASERHTVVSEPPPVDLVFPLYLRGALRPPIVCGMAAALGRCRNGATTRRFFKLDAWHTLALDRLAALFPQTPWVFLYRDPLEVLVSQARRPGLHVAPGAVPLDAFGLAGADGVPPGDFAAWVLDAICAAALGAADDPRGRLVAYETLPGAVGDTIMPHFGVVPDATLSADMRSIASRSAKQPGQAFTADGARKRSEAGDALRAQAARMHATHAALEARRLSDHRDRPARR